MAVVVLVLGYLLGSLPTGLLVVRALTGQDIRAIGSGNIGTVNVYRVAGLPAAVLVLYAQRRRAGVAGADVGPTGGDPGGWRLGRNRRTQLVPVPAVQRGEGDRHFIWSAARHLHSGGFGRCRGVGHRRGRHAVCVAGLLARHDFRPGDDVVAQGAASVSRIWTYHPDVCGVPSSRECSQADLRNRTPGDRQTSGVMTVHAVPRA